MKSKSQKEKNNSHAKREFSIAQRKKRKQNETARIKNREAWRDNQVRETRGHEACLEKG